MQNHYYPPHWKFALRTTFTRLEQLILRFDVVAETGAKGYTGVPLPDELLTIIDGFLSEQEQLVEGDVRRLQQMRDYLQKHLVPIYHAGRQLAQNQWHDALPEQRRYLADLTLKDVRRTAWSSVPTHAGSTEANWFVEGFCYTWWHDEYPEYLLSTAGRV